MRSVLCFAALVGCGAPPGPCGDGGWGLVSDPVGALQVRTDGDDSAGDGTGDRPYATLERAVEAAAAAGSAEIAIGPGTWTGVAAALRGTTPLSVRACGTGETILEGGSTDPVIDVSGSEADLGGMTLRITLSERDVAVHGYASLRLVFS